MVEGMSVLEIVSRWPRKFPYAHTHTQTLTRRHRHRHRDTDTEAKAKTATETDTEAQAQGHACKHTGTHMRALETIAFELDPA